MRLAAQLNRAAGEGEPRLEVEREEEDARRDATQGGYLRDVRAHAHEGQEDREAGQVGGHRLPLVDLGGGLDSRGHEQQRYSEGKETEGYSEAGDGDEDV